MEEAEAQEAETGDSGAIMDRLLSMGKSYRAEGNAWHAMEIFWELVEDFPQTRQSGEARAILLELAVNYESEGSRHVARKIYERLL